MRIVDSWLREFCPTDLGVEELAELLTSRGAEVERIDRPWDGLDGVVVASVLEVRDHPNSDKLCLALVSTGDAEREVVVGVRNMRPGDLVPLAGPGASVPVLPEPLGAREIRGVVSDGMLCSPMELGIAPTHEGILILPSDLRPGTDLKVALGLDEAVFDIEVTPNRPDFLSVIGVAREVAAATGVPYLAPDADVQETDERASDVATIDVRDATRCPRYLARVLRGVRHTTSPLHAQARLTAAGMRPISAAVDATNYAMLEVGQPLHAFDIALLKGPGIVVRTAEAGELLVTLDDVERTFTEDDLLICDVERPVAVAGVMGGAIAEVSDATTEILLESATFERGGIQRTRRRIALSTEASMRFERGVDPEGANVGADRACRLLAAWTGAQVLAGAIDVGAAPPRRRIGMRSIRASRVIGYTVDPADATAVFHRLQMTSEVDGDSVIVEVPGYRVDIEGEIDLIEEVVRVQGYETVGSTLPAIRQPGGVPPDYAFRDRVRQAMVAAGLREVWSLPFAPQADLELTGDRDAIRVMNPVQADEGWLRTRLTPGLLRTLQRNVSRQVPSAAIFEVGTVFRVVDGAPDERPKLAFAMTGEAEHAWTGVRPYDFFDAKGVVEALMAHLGIEWSLGEPLAPPFHGGRSSALMVAGEKVGVLGEIHPGVGARLDIPGRIAAAELEIARLMHHATGRLATTEIPRFPPVRRDLSFVLDASVSAGAVTDAIVAASEGSLAACRLFDVFEGAPLAEGKKGLTYSLDLRDPDGTMAGERAAEIVDRIARRIREQLGGELRTT